MYFCHPEAVIGVRMHRYQTIVVPLAKKAHIRAMLGLGKPTADEEARRVDANVELFMRAYGAT